MLSNRSFDAKIAFITLRRPFVAVWAPFAALRILEGEPSDCRVEKHGYRSLISTPYTRWLAYMMGSQASPVSTATAFAVHRLLTFGAALMTQRLLPSGSLYPIFTPHTSR
ncbi:hypothetical protein DL93DRAFT_305852 [Clavulina sp. PMI_390]|nr:hypothetical protein DL93DRAFT_305852 [Clavulina sp. PMI_390]